MIKFIKRLFLFSVFILLCFSLSPNVSAAERDFKTEVTYDLLQGGTQEFLVHDKSGNEVTITISEIADKSRVDNGTYKITYNSKPCWKAGFYVVISNNCITSVKNEFYTLYSGSVLSDTLVKESSKQASYYLKYRLGSINYNTGVRANISGTSLNASGI